VLEKLSADQRVDLLAWLRDVLVKKIRRTLPEADGLDAIIDTFEKGEDEPMIYAIERMIDEIEEKAREEGKEEGIEEGIEKERSELLSILSKLGLPPDTIRQVEEERKNAVRNE
jgi:hypothetical protein